MSTWNDHLLPLAAVLLSLLSLMWAMPWYWSMTAFDVALFGCSEVHHQSAEGTAMPLHSNLYVGVYAEHFGSLELARSGGGFNELKSFSFTVKFYGHERLLHHQIVWRASEYFCNLWAPRFLIIFWTIEIPPGMCFQDGMKPGLPFMVVIFSAFMPAKLCQVWRLLSWAVLETFWSYFRDALRYLDLVVQYAPPHDSVISSARDSQSELQCLNKTLKINNW